MKKNYIRPSLLTETFVANNIMADTLAAEEFLSGGAGLYLNGTKYNVEFNGVNTIHSIKLSEFIK